MSRTVDVLLEIRALDVRSFVADFAKKYHALIEDGKPPESERDVIVHMMGGLDFEECECDPETKCWYATGYGDCNGWWAFEGYPRFFEWCAPYLTPDSRFCLSICGDAEVFWSRYYGIADGRLEVRDMSLCVWDDVELEAPKVSQVIECLERRRPTAEVEDDQCSITFELYGYGWSAVEDEDSGCGNVPDDIRYDLDLEGSDDYEERRAFSFFFLNFRKKGDSITDLAFDGPVLDWNRYVVFDNGLTMDDLATAVREYVTVDPRNKPRRQRLY